MPKKKTALTIEERLQQALVPAEEQPYEVPENWVWVRLGAVCNASKEKSNDFSNDIKYIGLEHLEKDQGIVGFSSADKVKSTKNAFKKGQILYGRLRPYLNKHDICSFDGVCSTDILVFEASNLVSNVLVDKFLNLPFFIDYVVSNSKGINLPRVSEETVLNTTFPLPPLSEQQRIVERIEELFAKLDEAKERLQEVADSFVVRKAAILHKAFTGELIGKKIEQLVPLESLVDLIKIGPFGSALHESDYIENGIPLVNPKHIVQQHIVPQSKISISEEKAEELSSYRLKANDIVLGRRGEMGRCAPVSAREENWICGTGSMIIRLKEEYDARLYSLILGSQATVTYLENSAVGSTLKNLNEKIVRKIPVPQFDIEEQHEIVRLIDDLLARERAAKQATEQALASIDLMKKSILARAFRGELGTNKASEASALELLQQVLAEN